MAPPDQPACMTCKSWSGVCGVCGVQTCLVEKKTVNSAPSPAPPLQVDAIFDGVGLPTTDNKHLFTKAFTTGIRVFTPNGELPCAIRPCTMLAASVLDAPPPPPMPLLLTGPCSPWTPCAGDMVTCSLPYLHPNTSQLSGE